MDARGDSPGPPATPDAGPSSGRGSPWSAQAEIELRREAEWNRNHWKSRCVKAENDLKVARSTISEEQGNIQFMARGSTQFKYEVRVLRQKLGRWDERSVENLPVSHILGNQNHSPK